MQAFISKEHFEIEVAHSFFLDREEKVQQFSFELSN